MSWSKAYEPYGKITKVESGLVYQIVFPEPMKEIKQWTVLTCASEGMRDFQLEQCQMAYQMGRGMRWQLDENISRHAKDS